MNLAPCPFRQVDDEGHILCEKIKSGDREVSPNVCRACPVAAINCGHLRATLDHESRPPITVRYGNGRTEIWEEEAPSILLHRAACAVKVMPILSPRDCAGCPLRQALVSPEAIIAPDHIPAPAPVRKTASRPRVAAPPSIHPTIPTEQGMPMVAQPQASVANVAQSAEEVKRSSIVAQKIIKLQEWLDKQKNAPHVSAALEDEQPLPRVATARSSPRPSRAEEKRVGWTD
ncbi:MAG TPA: hypothetical protein VF932_03335 [Anaerolineae bacterium]